MYTHLETPLLIAPLVSYYKWKCLILTYLLNLYTFSGIIKLKMTRMTSTVLIMSITVLFDKPVKAVTIGVIQKLPLQILGLPRPHPLS